jgi:hypothetical protein
VRLKQFSAGHASSEPDTDTIPRGTESLASGADPLTSGARGEEALTSGPRGRESSASATQ